jgi:phosphohistidine phosphatase
MKDLLLLRHGKSDWGASFQTDHDRPLANRGRSAAHQIGSFLAAVGPVPQLILTSSALRAKDTAELAKEGGNWPSLIVTTSQLYETGPLPILDLLRQQKDEIDTIMLVGHNPTWEDLAHHLIGGGHFRFPTAALARIRLPGNSWSQLVFGQGTLSWLVTPKLLKKLL